MTILYKTVTILTPGRYAMYHKDGIRHGFSRISPNYFFNFFTDKILYLEKGTSKIPDGEREKSMQITGAS
jgi:hypothetical protein